VDDSAFEPELPAVPAGELEAARRSLAELGAQPLPADVLTRLEARLAAELDSSPLSERRSHRGRVRLGAALSATAAVAAIAVFALSWSGGGHAPAGGESSALRSGAPTVQADASAKTAIAATGAHATRKTCPPASRTGGDRPRAACPGARGGHARAV
jgi:hypothetical protein